ncbi:hypothetical protein ACM46_11430 [Chryseobacterium angstadtii]|uniref:HTH gntR-type domain-containing protein n=1 Tax=Chryseobacterium angstadtii TaxID=558151 RepID=A0A0J7IFU4_9FLAO|nr:PLP-dependent aminotransferase family protein [Chryseobacterium angstadtii]KMQ64826.1 hypothetical protein ACM46_11430 [Chryseobacterium angstadtii]
MSIPVVNISNFISPDLFYKKFKKNQLKYLTIKEVFRDIIEQNKILTGTKIPSSRVLAELLKVSRSSVIKAYELLVFEGLIESKKGAGYIILERVKKDVDTKDKINPEIRYPSISDTGKSFQSNVHIMNTTSDQYIAFRPGLPPLDIFPINQWKNLYNLYWRNVKASSLNYSNVSGIINFKKNIAEYLYSMRGIQCNPEQIIIVSGSLQSLFLVGSALINPGDPVIMENPTFPNVHSIFKSLNAELHALEVDEEGINVHLFPEEIKPKIIHVTPSNQYPTGIKMSRKRKLDLLEWATEKGSIIIENDYDHEISNWGLKDPSLFEMDHHDRVVYLGTFNRLLHPSIRLGYMIVPYYLLDVIKALQKHSHRFVSPSNQIVMSEFIKRNYLFNHIKNVIDAAEEREYIFKTVLTENIHESFRLQDSGVRSLHLLGNIDQSLDDRKLVSILKDHQIIAHPYSKCFISSARNGIILGHTAVRKHLMQNKIIEIAQVYNKLIKNIW